MLATLNFHKLKTIDAYGIDFLVLWMILKFVNGLSPKSHLNVYGPVLNDVMKNSFVF